jgi:hypothetical protein
VRLITADPMAQRWQALRFILALTGRSPRAYRIHWVALAAAVVASALLLGWVLFDCRSGFDFTDESFYLNWIANPWRYPASLSQFGFVYHPLYLLVGGDVVRLRQANVLILFGLAWLLGRALLGSIFGQATSAAAHSRAGLEGSAFAAASGALLLLQVWLPTPNYNSLTLQSIMLATAGGLLTSRARWRGVAGWLLMGLGGGLAFLAKPPSAAMLGLRLALYLGLVRRFRLAGLLIAVASAALLVAIAALAIDGSLSGFVRRVVEGLELSNRRLGVARTTDRLFDLEQLFSRQHLHFMGLLIVAGLGLFAVNSVLREAKAMIRVPSRNNLALVGLLTALPCAFAFGTNSPYWPTATCAGSLWLLAALVLCLDQPARASWQNLLPALALSLVMVATTLFTATRAPYRQTEPLNRQHSAIDLPPGTAPLLVSAQVANYITEMRRLAAANGFQSGDLMLDLTGESPGSLYAIGAVALAAPWTLGGYTGSAAFVATALDAESCKAIAASWLLDAPATSNSIPATILERQGADAAADYSVAGSIHAAGGAASDVDYRLLKPVRSPEAAEAACEKARQGG